MSDPIASARAMIEPLIGYTPRPWSGHNMVHADTGKQMTPEELGEYVRNAVQSPRGNPDRFLFVSGKHEDGGDADVCHTGNGPMGPANTRLIAAAPDLRDMVATLADALEAERAARQKAEAERDQALARLAAVRDEAVDWLANRLMDWWGRENHESNEFLREFIPAAKASDPDAQAALDKLLAEARLEGWRAGREAAAEHCWAKRDLLADAEQKQVAAGLTGRDYYGRRLEAELLSRSIRALPEGG